MARFLTVVVLVAIVLFWGAPALGSPGLQVTTCENLGGDVWRYTFFACTPNVDANDLHVRLLDLEISQGEAIVACDAPALPGFSCNFTPTEATYLFPTVGPFECVPDLPGDANKFVVDVLTTDGVSLVEEIWTLDGSVVAGFNAVISCPPISVEPETWGRVKALYR